MQQQLNLLNPSDLALSGCDSRDGSERARLEARFAPLIREELGLRDLVSYVGNKSVPILRLYRYKEAFAFGFVEHCIKRLGITASDYVFDPFCGMGTTPFAAAQNGIAAIGIDRLPIAAFVSQTLPLFLTAEPGLLRSTFELLKSRVHRIDPAPVAMDVRIMKVAFPEETLDGLRRWKGAIDDLPQPAKDMFLLLFFSILEPCSYTAKDGQFLRLKRNKKIPLPVQALEKAVSRAEADILAARRLWRGEKAAGRPVVQLADARDLQDVLFERKPTAIITSPPYANRYDYTRTYSLELCFHFVKNFDELKQLRFDILRSHIESKEHDNDNPPHPAVEEVVNILRKQKVKLNNPRIPTMLTAYFVDMQKVIREWARVLAPRAVVAMVVDNVRFHGEMVPVDLILSEMAEQSGFRVNQILISRYKGNSSQQMDKYGRVPVRESVVLWAKEG
ncbi:MAG: DNA methyltransferase [Anaerolineae bacterium]